jgi:hypothetical protein
MKKILLFGTIAGMVSLYACKKDGTTTTVTNTVHDTTTNTVTVFASGKINGDSLSTGINVAYGTRISDSTLPAASNDGDAPVLDTTYSRIYSVVRSRYLTIYPPNVAGYVAGYYVQIVGAKSYFKIDYPAAVAGRKAAKKAELARLSKETDGRISTKPVKTARGTGDGYIDSTIVLKLPASVRGDTFYVKYAAYDLSNRVSKAITAMVVILSEGSAGLTDSLTGNWRYLGYQEYYNGTPEGDFSVDTTYSYYGYYNCDGTTLSGTESETEYYLPYQIRSYNEGYQLGKYSMVYSYLSTRQYLNLEQSSCSNLFYDLSIRNQYQNYGGYSYDSRSKKITFINDGNGNGYSNIDLSYDSYYLSALTDSTMILSGVNNGENSSDDNYTQLNKYIKQ